MKWCYEPDSGLNVSYDKFIPGFLNLNLWFSQIISKRHLHVIQSTLTDSQKWFVLRWGSGLFCLWKYPTSILPAMKWRGLSSYYMILVCKWEQAQSLNHSEVFDLENKSSSENNDILYCSLNLNLKKWCQYYRELKNIKVWVSVQKCLDIVLSGGVSQERHLILNLWKHYTGIKLRLFSYISTPLISIMHISIIVLFKLIRTLPQYCSDVPFLCYHIRDSGFHICNAQSSTRFNIHGLLMNN